LEKPFAWYRIQKLDLDYFETSDDVERYLKGEEKDEDTISTLQALESVSGLKVARAILLQSQSNLDAHNFGAFVTAKL
jgi:hypothetical protein